MPPLHLVPHWLFIDVRLAPGARTSDL